MDIDGQLRFLTYRMLDDSPIVKARMVREVRGGSPYTRYWVEMITADEIHHTTLHYRRVETAVADAVWMTG